MQRAGLEGGGGFVERKSAYWIEAASGIPPKLIVPTLRVGMPQRTLRVRLYLGRRASPAAFPRGAWERSLGEEHLARQSMPLHLFIEGPARQLKFFKHRFHIALVPGQRRAQALRFKRFLLRRQ